MKGVLYLFSCVCFDLTVGHKESMLIFIIMLL